jgi:hypothetical protein
MIHCSIPQAMRFVAELMDCYYGKNSFGGNVAEIYRYTLHGHCPTLGLSQDTGMYKDAEKEINSLVAGTTFDLLDYFSSLKECQIFVNDQLWGGWIRDYPEMFSHRFYIKIKRIKNVK